MDVLRAEAVADNEAPAQAAAPLEPPAPAAADMTALAELVSRWQSPLLLAGGGVLAAEAEALLVQLAERLGTPVFHTLTGKTAIPSDHPWRCRLALAARPPT